jgi:hypothetical protein
VSKYNIYRQCVATRGVGGVESVGDHILQEFNTLYLTNSESTKLLDHPKEKGEEASDK